MSVSTNTPLRAAEGGGSGASIIVAYVQGTTSQDITQIEEKYGLKFVKELAAANSRVYTVPAKATLEKVLRKLGTERAIRYAEADQEVSIEKK